MLRGLIHALSNAGQKDFHLVRTAHEWASVFSISGPHGETVRVLDVGGAYQSATYVGKRRFEPVFEYYRTFDIVFRCGIPLRRVLMIGGGGCSWPKHAATTHPGFMIDVVEEDRGVIDIARRFFFANELEKRGHHLIAAEGRSYLERAERVYDAILNDAFRGAEPAYHLATVEAAYAIKRNLAPKGVYLSNIVSRNGGSDLSFLRDAVATLREAFANVQVIPCPDTDYSDEDNFLVVATDVAMELEGALPYDEAFPGVLLRDESVPKQNANDDLRRTDRQIPDRRHKPPAASKT